MASRGSFRKRQRPSVAVAAAGAVERLENRWLMSTASFDYTNFGTTSGIDYNSYGVLIKTQGSSLVLTDSHTNEDRSALYDTLVPITNFTTHFTYQSNADPTSGDGFTFVFDTGAPTDVGTFGRNLGYGGGTFGRHSYDIAFNIFNEGNYQETFATVSAGAQPVAQVGAAEINLHNGDPFNGTITYDGSTLTVTLVDADNPSSVFTVSGAVNLPHILQSNTAYVGFTGATGDAISTQLISNWDFNGVGVGGPSITSGPTASSPTLAGTKTTLRVGATSSDGSALTYTWHTEHVPPGAPTPKFSTPTAASTSVQVYKDGTYTFQVSVTDASGNTVTGVNQVVVTQVASGLRLTPHGAKVKIHGTQQYKVVVLDQFAHPMRINPTVTYHVGSGVGSISSSGLFSAGAKAGKYLLDIDADNIPATIAGTVVA